MRSLRKMSPWKLLLLLTLAAFAPLERANAQTFQPASSRSTLSVGQENVVRIVPPATPDSLAGLLREGTSLESSHRWGEALSHYERALKEHPQNRILNERVDLAKIHYSLDRRYRDKSFNESIATLDARTAAQLYAEILLKINAHYVTTPDWTNMVARGTKSFDIALADPAFRQRYIPRVDNETLDSFRRQMFAVAQSNSVRTRHDARRVVEQVSALGSQRLGLSPTAVVFEYIAGATGGLDDYSSYLTADDLSEVYSQIEGDFVGLGVELKADHGDLLIVRVIPGSPALAAGIGKGDRIIEVDGHSTKDLTVDAAASLLQGEEGSLVALKVNSPGAREARRVTVRRQHVEVPAVENVHMVDPAYGIAYVRLPAFQKTTSRDLDKAMWDLHNQGMRSLILDLRGNPGGLLTASVEVVDKFVQHGGIVSTRGRSPHEDFDYQAQEAGTWRVPLVVLIDGDSASASEIFAGAIRDHGRGVVVGETSYGKGSVQGIFPLGFAGAGVRLTTAKFYSPSGSAISKVGVQPHIVVRHAAKAAAGSDPARDQEDEVLRRGVEQAKNLVASR